MKIKSTKKCSTIIDEKQIKREFQAGGIMCSKGRSGGGNITVNENFPRDVINRTKSGFERVSKGVGLQPVGESTCSVCQRLERGRT